MITTISDLSFVCQLDKNGTHRLYLYPYDSSAPNALKFAIARKSRSNDEWFVWAESIQDFKIVQNLCHNEFEAICDLKEILSKIDVVEGFSHLPSFISWNLKYFDKKFGYELTKICIKKPTWPMLTLEFTRIKYPVNTTENPKSKDKSIEGDNLIRYEDEEDMDSRHKNHLPKDYSPKHDCNCEVSGCGKSSYTYNELSQLNKKRKREIEYQIDHLTKELKELERKMNKTSTDYRYH